MKEILIIRKIPLNHIFYYWNNQVAINKQKHIVNFNYKLLSIY